MDISGKIKEFFSDNGILAKHFPGYEYRESQLEMSLSILENLENKTHIFVEAPTGVGKSFAYLVPAIYYAKLYSKKAIISTHTINLQEQLISKDLPFLHNILPLEFKSTIIKGKRNYLCPKRLRKAYSKSDNLFDYEESEILEQINSWSKKTTDGTLSDVPFKLNMNVWDSICAEVGICSSKTCGSIETTECFFQKAKHKVFQSDIVIINHHLFFTLFDAQKTNDSPGYLYNNDFVIFDEAHTLESVASDHIVPSISRDMIKYHLLRLYNEKKKRGLLLNYPALDALAIVSNLIDLNNYFFYTIRKELFDEYKKSENNITFRVYEKNPFGNSLNDEIIKLINSLKSLRKFSKDEMDENQLTDFISRFTEINFCINNFIEQKYSSIDVPEYVYWVELSSLKPDSNVSLCTSPVSLSDYFRKNIFKKENSAILTSATLSTNKEFSYIKSRLGGDSAGDLILSSPFDFKKQIKLYLVKSILQPEKENDDRYTSQLKSWLNYFIDITDGKALVLFTNSKMMKKISSMIKEEINSKKINLYVQGEGESSKRLLEKFKKDRDSVLFGLDSFWLGIDVPGDSLSNLIITKLPFQVPNQPLIQARIEYIEKMGGNSFNDYSLPEAVIKFRQGFGRLVRSKSDTGIVVILDSRILSKSYGKVFLNSIEKCTTEII